MRPNRILPLLVAATFLPLTACGAHDRASAGNAASRSYPVTGFTDVRLTGPDDATIAVGPAFSVRAEGDAAVLDRLTVERRGSTLAIGRRSGTWTNNGSARVFVTMPAIAGASISGSGDIAIDKASGEALAVQVSGSGSVDVKRLAVRRVQVSIAGSGNVSAQGRAQMLSAWITGSGDLQAPGLIAQGAEVSVSGSGGVIAAVTGRARVKVVGSGDIDLGPDATCATTNTGSGEVRCGR